MAIKYSQIINLLRDNYSGVIKASDPDFVGICDNCMRNNATNLNYYVSKISLSGINKLDLANKNGNLYLCFPVQGQIHYYLQSSATSLNYTFQYLKDDKYNNVGYLQYAKIAGVPKEWDVYISYYYLKMNNTFNLFGNVSKGVFSGVTRKAKINGNVRYTGLFRDTKDGLIAINNIPNVSSGWIFGVGLVFKNIHKNFYAIKNNIGIRNASRWNYDLWVNNNSFAIANAGVIDINHNYILDNYFSVHNQSILEEITLSDNTIWKG